MPKRARKTATQAAAETETKAAPKLPQGMPLQRVQLTHYGPNLEPGAAKTDNAPGNCYEVGRCGVAQIVITGRGVMVESSEGEVLWLPDSSVVWGRA